MAQERSSSCGCSSAASDRSASRRSWSLHTASLYAFAGLCGFLSLLIAFSVLEVSNIRKSLPAPNAVERTLAASDSLSVLDKIQDKIQLLQQAADPAAARSAGVLAADMLINPVLSDREIQGTLSKTRGKIQVLVQHRMQTDKTQQELRAAQTALLQTGYMLSPDFDTVQEYPDFVPQCRQQVENKASASPAAAAQCTLFLQAVRDYEHSLSALQQLQDRGTVLQEDVHFQLSLMRAHFEHVKSYTLQLKPQRLDDISRELVFYTVTLCGLMVTGCIAVYLLVFKVLVSPMQHIASAIRNFHTAKGAGALNQLPKSRLREIRDMTALLSHLFADFNRLSRDSSQLMQRYSELLTISYYDELTGAHNRRALELFSRTAGHLPSGLAVLMIDIDFFKKYNDTLGHQKGDKVLRRVSTCLIKNTSDNDLVYRYGGEEFCVVLQNVTDSLVHDITQRLCRAVRQLNLLNPGTGNKPVTISIGSSPVTLPEHDYKLEDLIARADRALYEAKNTGRDRVCMFCEIREPCDTEGAEPEAEPQDSGR